MVRDILFFCSSTPKTHTFTTSPTFSTSEGCFINLSVICEMWTRPSWCTPISTNAPKSITFLTVPVSSIPVLRSLADIISCRKSGGGSSSRGSLPGLSSSFIISLSVGTPILSLCAVLSIPKVSAAVRIAAVLPFLTSASVIPQSFKSSFAAS